MQAHKHNSMQAHKHHTDISMQAQEYKHKACK